MAKGKELYQIEGNYNTKKVIANGINAWVLLKDQFHYSIFKNKLNYSAKLRTRSKWQLFQNFFWGITTLFNIRAFDYLFFSNTNKRELIGSSYFDVLLDAWADKVGQDKSCFIEWAASSHFPQKKVHSTNIFSDLPFKFFTYIFSLFVKVNLQGEKALNDIAKEVNININYQKELKQELGAIYFYKLLFSFVKPKAIFVLSSYSKTPIVIAAHLLRIKVYEPQHGFIGKNHYFYYKFSSYSKLYSPDYLISFGSYEKQINAKNFIFESKNIFPVGSYYLENVKSKFKSNELEQIRNKFEKVFCITLQGIFEKELLDWIVKEAEEHQNWIFILRVKYADDGYEEYTKLPNIKMFNHFNIYQILKYSDVNITIFSTTAIEASFYNVKTFFYNINGLSTKYFDIDEMYASKFEPGTRIKPEDFGLKNKKNESYFVNGYLENVTELEFKPV